MSSTIEQYKQSEVVEGMVEQTIVPCEVVVTGIIGDAAGLQRGVFTDKDAFAFCGVLGFQADSGYSSDALSGRIAALAAMASEPGVMGEDNGFERLPAFHDGNGKPNVELRVTVEIVALGT